MQNAKEEISETNENTKQMINQLAMMGKEG